MDSDRVEGEAKEVAGKVTGDKDLEAEGEGQSAWGKTKDAAEDAKDAVEDKLDR